MAPSAKDTHPPGPWRQASDGQGAPGARARVRAAVAQEVLDAGRAELVEHGPAALSLRAVARRCGMVPSAIYRYFPSRDHLLTALVVEAYESVAAAATQADAAARAETVGTEGSAAARWVAVGRAVRAWAVDHEQHWALVFGTPIPGFAGSEVTTEAAMRLHLVPVRVMGDAYAAGVLGDPAGVPIGPALEAAVAPLVPYMGGVPAAQAAAWLAAWSMVLGTVSLERFGHYAGSVDGSDAYFAHVLRLAGSLVGLEVPAVA